MSICDTMKQGHLGASALFAESLQTDIGVYFVSEHLIGVKRYAKSDVGISSALHPGQQSSPEYR